MATYKSSDWKEVKFNGQDVTKIILNGTTVWEKITILPPEILSVREYPLQAWFEIRNPNPKDYYLYYEIIDTDNGYVKESEVYGMLYADTTHLGITFDFHILDTGIYRFKFKFVENLDGSGEESDYVDVDDVNIVEDTSTTTTTYALLNAVATEGNFTLYRGENNE